MKKIYLALLVIVLSVPAVKAQILYSNTFSTSLGNMTAANGSSGNWIWTNNCAASNSAGHSAPGSAIFQGSGCQFGNGSNTVSGDLTTPSIPIGSSGAVLTFNYLINNECTSFATTCTYDILKLQISNNGGVSWTDIMSNGTGSLVNTGVWIPVTYSLNSYSNQSILIRFNFNSIDGAINAYDGIYVDDIIVTGNCFVSLAYTPSNTAVTPTICAGNSLTLTTNAVSNYSWSTGASSSSIVVSPTANTVYTVAATSSANCVSNNSLAVVVNNAVPSISIANTASVANGVCPTTSVTLTASGANSYVWNGSQSITNGVPFLPSGSGNFTVSGTNACGTTTAAVSISIHPVPSVTAVASQPTICSNNPVTITGIGNAISYSVNGNNPNGSQLYPSATMVHTVVGTNSLGCTTAAFVGVTVVTTPQAPPLPSPPLICIGSTATLSSNGATNYTWTTGASSVIGSSSSLTVNPTSTTIYTLTKSNANCVNTQTVQVLVNNLPVLFAFANPSLVCAGKTSTLNGAGALTYTWSAPGNQTYTGSNPVVLTNVNTTYTLTASDGTCANTTTLNIVTKPNPTVGIVASNTNICFGETVTLTATGAIGYTWSASSFTATPSQTTITDAPGSSALYQLVGVNNVQCTTGISQVVLVRTTPTLNVQTTKPLVCKNGAAGLSVTAIGAPPFTYTWDANAGATQGSLAIVNPQATGIYTVTGTNAQSCTATGTVLVSVFLPTFAVNNPTSSCLGGTVVLQASGANSYTWQSTGSTFQNLPVTPTGPTVYLVSATSNSTGVSCVSTQSINVTIYQNPTVTAVATRTQICIKESTTVKGFGAVSYDWSNQQTGSVVPVNPISNTTYTVTGTDQNGCTGTATVQVKTSTCIGLDKLAAEQGLEIYPNPNNGSFIVKASTDCEITLSNELGQVLRTDKLELAQAPGLEYRDMPPGIYLLQVNSQGTVSAHRIVVTR